MMAAAPFIQALTQSIMMMLLATGSAHASDKLVWQAEEIVLAQTFQVAQNQPAAQAAANGNQPDKANQGQNGNPWNDGPLPAWLNECWTCNILRTAFKGIMDFSKNTHQTFTTGLSDLIVVVLSLFLLMQAGKILLPFGASERPKEILNTMAIRLVQTIVVLGLLTQQEKAWNWLFYPITMTATAISFAILETAGELSGEQLKACPANNNADERLFNMIDCNVIRIQDSIGFGMKLGYKIMFKVFEKQDTAWDTFVAFLSFLPSLISGLALLIVFGIAILSVPFRTIDVLLKWAVFVIFSPLILAAAIFPSTREFSVNSIKILVQASLIWVMTAAIVGVTMIVMAQLVQDTEGLLFKGLGGTAFDATFWQLLAIGVILNTMLGKAPDIAAKAVGGAQGSSVSFGSNIANSINNFAANALGNLFDSVEKQLMKRQNRKYSF